MNRLFKIVQSSTSLEDRPPISYKVREYFEILFTEKLIEYKKANDNWDYILSMLFVSEGRHKLKEITLSESPKIIRSDKVKLYEIHIPISLIKKSTDPQRKSIETILEAIMLFIKKKYKKIKEQDERSLLQEIDWQYLLRLPYPALKTEQKYIEDKLGIGNDNIL